MTTHFTCEGLLRKPAKTLTLLLLSFFALSMSTAKAGEVELDHFDGLDLLVDEDMSRKDAEKIRTSIAPLKRQLAWMLEQQERFVAFNVDSGTPNLSPFLSLMVQAHQRHFGSYNLAQGNKLLKILQKFVTTFDEKSELKIRLGKDKCQVRQNSQTAAFVWMTSSGQQVDPHRQWYADINELILYVCPVFLGKISSVEQAATVVHELSHLLLNTQDLAYRFSRKYFSPKFFPQPSHRFHNADSYAGYFQDLLEAAAKYPEVFDSQPVLIDPHLS